MATREDKALAQKTSAFHKKRKILGQATRAAKKAGDWRQVLELQNQADADGIKIGGIVSYEGTRDNLSARSRQEASDSANARNAYFGQGQPRLARPAVTGRANPQTPTQGQSPATSQSTSQATTTESTQTPATSQPTPQATTGGDAQTQIPAQPRVAQPRVAQPRVAQPTTQGQPRGFREGPTGALSTGLDYSRSPAEVLARVRDGRQALALGRGTPDQAFNRGASAVARHKLRNPDRYPSERRSNPTGQLASNSSGGVSPSPLSSDSPDTRPATALAETVTGGNSTTPPSFGQLNPNTTAELTDGAGIGRGTLLDQDRYNVDPRREADEATANRELAASQARYPGSVQVSPEIEAAQASEYAQDQTRMERARRLARGIEGPKKVIQANQDKRAKIDANLPKNELETTEEYNKRAAEFVNKPFGTNLKPSDALSNAARFAPGSSFLGRRRMLDAKNKGRESFQAEEDIEQAAQLEERLAEEAYYAQSPEDRSEGLNMKGYPPSNELGAKLWKLRNERKLRRREQIEAPIDYPKRSAGRNALAIGELVARHPLQIVGDSVANVIPENAPQAAFKKVSDFLKNRDSRRAKDGKRIVKQYR